MWSRLGGGGPPQSYKTESLPRLLVFVLLSFEEKKRIREVGKRKEKGNRSSEGMPCQREDRAVREEIDVRPKRKSLQQQRGSGRK